MTTPSERAWTEDDIAALVDGAIESAAEIARLNKVIETDREAAVLAADLRALQRLSRDAFDAPMTEPLPARIEAAIFGEPDKIAPFPQRSRRRAPGLSRVTGLLESPARLAAAAALTLAIGVGAGQFLSVGDGVVAALGVAPENGPLHRALETTASGEITAAGVQPMLSFLDAAGRPCREFEVIGELPNALEFGVACRGAEGRWRVEMLATAPVTPPGPEGYAPASGPAAAALDSLLDAIGAGPPLTPEQEADWIDRAWGEQGPAAAQ